MSQDHHDEEFDFTSPWTTYLRTAGLVLGIAIWALGAIIGVGLMFDDPQGMGTMYWGLTLMYGALPLTALGATLILSLAHFAYDLHAPVGKSLAIAPAVVLSVNSLLIAFSLPGGSNHLARLYVGLSFAATLHIPGTIIVVTQLLLGSDD